MSRVISSLSASNLAGPVSGRSNFLKSVVASHTLQGGGSIGDTIRAAYRSGPTVQLNRLKRWIRDPDQAGFLGQTYESLDKDPEILTTSGGAWSVLLPGNGEYWHAYPILVSVALEWDWLDNWYRPRAGFTWSGGPAAAYSRLVSMRASHGLSQIYPFVGPPIYMFWALEYWNNNIGFSPADRSRAWTASYNQIAGTITINVPGYATWTFNPGIDPNATYLYVAVGGFAGAWTYKLGSGDPIMENLAAAVSGGRPDSGYYPFIPVRLCNTSVASACPELNTQASKAFKKATGSKFVDVVSQIDSHPQVASIDMSMLTFGVQANTQSKYGRRYIYEYCRSLWQRAGSPSGPLAVRIGVDTPFPGGWGSQGGYGLTFKYIREEVLTGTVGAYDALWWETAGEEARLVWQDQPGSYRRMVMGTGIATLTGLPGNGASLGLWGEVGRVDESGFLFPLHKPTLTAIGVHVASEATQEALVLLNGSYDVITSSILSGIIFFITMVLVVAFAPAAIGATGAGLLGSNLAVGTAIGLTGGLAVLAGFLVNTLAAIILTKIITVGSKAIFGDKIGSIIGAVVGFVAVTVGTGLNNGMNVSQIWSNMASARNLLSLTNAVGSGISGYIQGALQELSGEMQQFNQFMDEKLREVQSSYAKNLGYDSGIIDPMGLTDTQFGNSLETPTQFLTRTLLVGSDIADISLNMVSRFTELTISTDLPLTP